MTSLWPFRYFVAECMTRSAPSAIGRVSTGVAAVLSTARSAPARCAIAAAPAMSVIDHSGLAGVSIHTSRVSPGTTAAASASSEVVSQNATLSRPSASAWPSQRRSAQYMTRGATTWAPGGSAPNSVVAAAIPDGNSSEAAPPSSAESSASGWS